MLPLAARRALWAFAIFALVGLPVSAQSSQPWHFPDDQSRRDAQRKSKYWYEAYPVAVDAIDSRNPDRAELEDAVARLRVCIETYPESSRKKFHEKERRNVEYFPYYYLARAFSLLNRPGDAKLCLDKEAAFGEIAASGKLAASFESLKSAVDALASAEPLLRQADTVAAWLAGTAGVTLSADGQQLAGGVKSTAEQLRAALGPPPSTAQLRSSSDKLMTELAGLCRGELASGSARLETVGASYSAAFSSRAAVDPRACAMPAGAVSAAMLASAQDAVQQCSRLVTEATRTAGSWACGELGKKRDEAAGIAQTLSAIGGDPGTVPALPASCGTAWAQASAAELQQALAGLDFAGARQRYESQIATVAGLIGQREEEALRTVTTTLNRVLRPSSECVANLLLANSKQRLDALPTDPREALAVPDLEQKVDDALAALGTDLEAGVRRLQTRSERYECQADLSSLDSVLADYQRGATNVELQALCAAARGASQGVRTCMGSRQEIAQEEVDESRWLVQAVLGTIDVWANAPVEAAETRDCLVRADRELGRSVGNDVTGWIERMEQTRTEARRCVATYVQLRADLFDDVATRVRGLSEPLKVLACDPPAPSTARFCGLRDDVEGLDSRVAAVASIRGDVNLEIRRLLADAGMESAVPEDWWGRHDAAEGDFRESLRGVIVDRAIGIVLTDAGTEVARWEQVVSVLKPFLALSDAFGAFERGELNNAIYALREAQARGALPEQGRPAALSHAALSYFLFVKSRAGAAGDAVELLRRDARREARQAVEADTTFELNQSLFASLSFQTFFDECCGSATP